MTILIGSSESKDLRKAVLAISSQMRLRTGGMTMAAITSGQRPVARKTLSIVVAALLVLLVCAGAMTLRAQTDTATVSGLITDSTGAIVPSAEVQLQNVAQGVSQTATTNNAGIYVFASVQPGSYQITVRKQGFKQVDLLGMIVNVQDHVEQNFKLELGSVSESITVNGNGLNINTTDGSVSTVVDRQFVENMPLNGRSFQDLILLTPGVVTQSPQNPSQASGYSGEFSVNGQRTESNVYTVDGVNANTGGYIYGYGTAGTSGSLPAATALGTTQSLVSVDALQEFRVASSSYSAEYGLSPGGQFSFITRSGTNDLHGTAFDYLRNNYFDANDWFNDYYGVPETPLRQNDFGGTLGGPAWIPKLYDGRNKSFFFFSYEGLRLTQPQGAMTEYVPSMALRQAVPSALQPALDAFPIPTGSALSNGLAPFIQNDSVPSSVDSVSVRFDQQIATKVKVFYRFGDTQSSSASRYLSNLSSVNQSSYTNTLGVTATLSGQITNDFRANYTSNVGESSSNIDNFGGAQAVDLRQLQNLNTSLNPTAYAEFDLFFAGYYPGLSTGTIAQPQHVWSIGDAIAISRGRQSLKVGIDYRRIWSRLQRSSPAVASIFNSSQALIANQSEYGTARAYAASYPAYTNAALYLQDEIRVNRRLNISAGLRWEVNPPPTQTQGTLPYIVQGDLNNISSLTLAPAGTRFWKTTYYNFAPRLGVAYQTRNRPGRETVLRAGGGVFFDSGQQSSTQTFGNSPGQSAFQLYPGASYPLTSSQINLPLVNPPVAPYDASAYYFPSRLQLPYTLEWNASVQQAFGASQALTVSYVGSNGRRLLSQGAIYPETGDFSNDGIILENSGTTSSYNALQLQFQRTLSRGLQVLASYNWAHAIDFGSQNINYPQIRGNADYDLRHNFNMAATYDINAGGPNRFVRGLLDHWGVDTRFSARTGFPVILNGNSITLPDGQTAYSGLNLVPGVPVYIYGSQYPGGRSINPAAFALPASGEQGDAPRNFVRGFGMYQLDMAVRRTFPLGERLNLQFRAEAFNILNHPNFGTIYSHYGSVLFGQSVQMLNQSLGNLSPLYQQGGPRSMQFALKLQF